MKKKHGNLYLILILLVILNIIEQIINRKKIKKVYLKTYFIKIKKTNNLLSKKKTPKFILKLIFLKYLFYFNIKINDNEKNNKQ